MPQGKIERIEPNGQFYEVYYADGYIFGATKAEAKQLAVGTTVTVTTNDRNQVVRVEANGRTVRDGVPAEFQTRERAPDGAANEPRHPAAQPCERLSERPEWRRARASCVFRAPASARGI